MVPARWRTIENGSVRLSEQLIYHGFSDLERPSADHADPTMDNETDRKYASRGEFVLRSPRGRSIVLLSAELAAEITAAIPDEDISAFQNITHASSLLNAPTFPSDVG